MRIKEFLQFNKENFFNGAVQTEWFYDPERVAPVANSFVFHGPKYFGVSKDDITLGTNKLIDTASFAQTLVDRVYSPQNSTNILLTIAGYGSGKSHLAVTLGTLFSGIDSELCSSITQHISEASAEAGEHIQRINAKKNLVLILNGMNNFNLDYEMLSCAKKSLSMHGEDESVLSNLTKSYDQAKHFVEQTFNIFENRYLELAEQAGIYHKGSELKKHLISFLETEQIAFNVVNAMYEEINGSLISWEHGISAGDILRTLSDELCGTGKPFNKVIVLFDEFGRYIEYVAANPVVAGEAALQQIFEATQSSKGKVVLVGFIQRDLSAYLSTMEQTSNIVRYVGRYEAGEKYYLSSNFETILANLIKKTNTSSFNTFVTSSFNRYQNYYSKMQSAILRWNRECSKKGVWKDSVLFNNVILQGCYPLHPITVCLLSNMSSFMQQRSPIAFAAEMFSDMSNTDIDTAWLPFVYPVNIIESSIYNEMLNSEERGLVQSQYCMLYRDIIVKIGDKLTPSEKTVLQAVLVINLGKFAFHDKIDALMALRYCSGIEEKDIPPVLSSLENSHGVIAYDESVNRFELIAEAAGFNEFKRVYGKYKALLRNFSGIKDYDEEINNELLLDKPYETSFAQEHYICSKEWCFAKRLVPIEDITEEFCNALIHTIEIACDAEKPRGIVVYAYCGENKFRHILSVQSIYKKLILKNYPIVFFLINDANEEIVSAMRIRAVCNQFPSAEKERFKKFISDQKRQQIKKIVKAFTSCMAQREYITEEGVVNYSDRIQNFLNDTLKATYYKVPPFPFDGFDKNSLTAAKKTLVTICAKLFDGTLMNEQSYSSLLPDEKNRVKAVLSTGFQNSWQVFDSNFSLIEPRDQSVKHIYDAISFQLEDNNVYTIAQLLKPYMLPPYGMNYYSVTLFAMYYIAKKGKEISAFYDNGKLKAEHIGNDIFKAPKKDRTFISELYRIKLQQKEKTDVDFIASTCLTILTNRYVEDCSSLKDKLNLALSQEDTDDENDDLVAQAKLRLDEGKKLHAEIYDILSNAEQLIQTARLKFSLIKFVKIFEYTSSCEGKINDSTNYEFSNEYIAKRSNLRAEAVGMISRQFDSALNAIRFDITQLSQYRQVYSNVAQVLANNGFSEQSERINAKVNEIEAELIAKQKYEHMILSCEQEIALCSNVENRGYNKCKQQVDQMEAWRDFVESKDDITESLKSTLVNKICEAEALLSKRISGIISQYSETLQKSREINSVEDMSAYSRQLDNLSKLDLPAEYLQKVQDLEKDLVAATTFCSSLSLNYNLTIKLKSELAKLQASQVLKSLEQIYASHLSRIRELQQRWVDQYLSMPKTEVNMLTADDCTRWLSDTESLPEYLDESAVSQYTYNRVKIQERLKSCRVQGVVAMYLNLSIEEQSECLNELLNKNYIYKSGQQKGCIPESV